MKQIYSNDSEADDNDSEGERGRSALDDRDGEGALYPELQNNIRSQTLGGPAGTQESDDN